MTVEIDNSQVAKISNEIGWIKNKVEGVTLTELAFCKTDFGNSEIRVLISITFWFQSP